MTKRPGSRERLLISWSLMPSLKYSCCGSPLRLLNGSTAIDGMLGSGSGFSCDGIEAEVRGGLSDTCWTITIVATTIARPVNDSTPLRQYFRGICRVFLGGGVAPSSSTRHTCTGRAMFL